MKANLDSKMKLPGPYFFKIFGQIYHYFYNSVKPKKDCCPKYNQMYIIDSEEANNIRMNHDANKDVCLKEVLKLIFFKNNYLKKFYLFIQAFYYFGHIYKRSESIFCSF